MRRSRDFIDAMVAHVTNESPRTDGSSGPYGSPLIRGPGAGRAPPRHRAGHGALRTAFELGCPEVYDTALCPRRPPRHVDRHPAVIRPAWTPWDGGGFDVPEARSDQPPGRSIDRSPKRFSYSLTTLFISKASRFAA